MASPPPQTLKVVVLAKTAHAAPAVAPWPNDIAGSAQAWSIVGEASPASGRWPLDWHQVTAAPHHPKGRWRTISGAPRRGLAHARNAALAWRCGLPVSAIYALKGDRWLRLALGEADVLLCADHVADEVLRSMPRLARGVTVLDSACATPTGSAWIQLRQWLLVIDAAANPDVPDAAQRPPRPPAGLEVALARHLEMIGLRTVERWPRDQSLALLSSLRGIQDELDLPDLLECAEAFAQMWRGHPRHSDDHYHAMTRRAAARADEALNLGDRPLAMHRLQSAAAVALHRARHAETPRSTLVERSSELLVPIRESAAYRRLRDDTVPRPALAPQDRPPPSTAGPFIPRVTILPGAYGTFHHDLVAALSGPARVRVSKLLNHPSLRRRRLTGPDLQLLDALRRGEVDVMRQRWDSAPSDLDPTAALVALKSLAKELRGADVVVGEWFDAATMWATHLVPPGTRLMVRAHGLDILDPWLHLVDWRGVSKVLATTPALRGLIQDLTGAFGAPDPALVLPYRPDLSGPDPQRDPDARFVIGMVGWGRQVKDPHFALDLLERDERRQLILIGPDFPKSGPNLTQAYADSFRERLRNPALAGRVEIVGRTNDVPRHLARVGIILSASWREGWHLGLIEGAASGAVPVVRNWPLLASREGARTTHPPEWVVEDLDEADRRISDLADPLLWSIASERARSMTLQRYAPGPIAEAYRALILG